MEKVYLLPVMSVVLVALAIFSTFCFSASVDYLSNFQLCQNGEIDEFYANEKTFIIQNAGLSTPHDLAGDIDGGCQQSEACLKGTAHGLRAGNSEFQSGFGKIYTGKLRVGNVPCNGSGASISSLVDHEKFSRPVTYKRYRI